MTKENKDLTLLPHNGLLQSAIPVLTIICQLNTNKDVVQINILEQQRITDELEKFLVHARSQKIPEYIIDQAHYVLCAVADEAYYVANNAQNLHQSTLLNRYHNDNQGGETFFQNLDRYFNDPIQYMSLLELMYICLALGFCGKYALLKDGEQILLNKRQKIFNILNQQFDYKVQPLLSDSLPEDSKFEEKRCRKKFFISITVIFIVIAASFTFMQGKLYYQKQKIKHHAQLIHMEQRALYQGD